MPQNSLLDTLKLKKGGRSKGNMKEDCGQGNKAAGRYMQVPGEMCSRQTNGGELWWWPYTPQGTKRTELN